MITRLITNLANKNTNLTPKSKTSDTSDYNGATIFGNTYEVWEELQEVDNPVLYEYMCYGNIDYTYVLDREYDPWS